MIEIKECSKSFGKIKAVNSVTLDIGDREVFGLVGTNGAGKSTLLRMVSGILKPDGGKFSLTGSPFMKTRKLRKVSSIYQTTPISRQTIHRRICLIFTKAIIQAFRRSVSIN